MPHTQSPLQRDASSIHPSPLEDEIKSITHSIASLLHELIEEDDNRKGYHTSPSSILTGLRTAESSNEETSQEIERDLNLILYKVSEGYKTLARTLQLQAAEKPELYHESVQSLRKLEKGLQLNFHNKIAYTRSVLDFFSGKSWKEILKLTSHDIQELYRPARDLYEIGHYERSALILGFLAWIDSKNADLWIFFGHALYYSSQYNEAIKAYYIASQCIPDEPWPHIYTAACYLAQFDSELYSSSLKIALQKEEAKGPKKDSELIQLIQEHLKECKQPNGAFPA